MAVGGIAMLAFVAMAIVAAVYPERGPKAEADQDPSASANPFPTLSVTAGPTGGPTPGVGVTSTARPGTPRPPTSGPATGPAGTTPPANPPSGVVTGAYTLPPATTWPERFEGQVMLTNTTTSAQSWQVRLVFPDNVGAYVTSWIDGNPSPTVVPESHGATFSGSVTIAAGKSVTLHFQFNRTAGDLAPRVCTVNGRTCSGV